MIDQFSHIGIKAQDPLMTAKWLEDQLEAKRLDSGEFGFDDWGQSVEFVGIEIGDKNAFVVAPTPYEAAGVVEDVDEGIAHFGLAVDDCEAAVNEVIARGGEQLLEPFELDNTRYGFCDGPVGFRIEFVEPLSP